MKVTFNRGDYYQSKNDIGYIDFICNEYICLCVREKERNYEQAKGSRLNYIQVKVLVMKHEWQSMTKLEQPNRFANKSNKNSLTLDDWS
tara:strand:+ start:194 stop:460 length:267 start_codon:yes stop_codon:yes gene_type:complete